MVARGRGGRGGFRYIWRQNCHVLETGDVYRVSQWEEAEVTPGFLHLGGEIVAGTHMDLEKTG